MKFVKSCDQTITKPIFSKIKEIAANSQTLVIIILIYTHIHIPKESGLEREHVRVHHRNIVL